MKKTPIRCNEGMALLLTTVFMAVAIVALTALGARIIMQSHHVDNTFVVNKSLKGAESGMAASWASINNEDDDLGMIGLGSWTLTVEDGEMVLPTFSSSGVAPLHLESNPAVEYMGLAQNWQNDTVDNNLDGNIDDTSEAGFYTIYGWARYGELQRGVEQVIASSDVNVWRNAIFAGSGQAGGLIKGNVSIHGSVHLLGDNLASGGTAISALDLSGTSLIHNNYAGIPAALSSRIPTLPKKTFNGELVETISAKLRVKHGLVGMSGNSEIGEVDIAGNGFKETMDGVYVGDGYTGNSVVDDGDRGDPTNLHSDNGWDERYDLGSKVSLPMFDDEYKELNTGNTYVNPSTGNNYTHYEYFTQVLSGTNYPGDMTIKANTNFYYNATHPTQTDPALRLPTDDYIYFVASTNVMDINGQITVKGNLSIQPGSGSDKTINYTGRGSILVDGNATCDTNLLSQNSNGTTANSYPKNNVLGIMAKGNVTVGTTSQLTMMAAFYAQGTVSSTKQTITAGSFVGSYFDMGTNVPEIFQVPDLAENLPIGMIGGYPVLIFSPVSWREIA